MLYVIGLGLGNEKDITIRGLEAVKRCEKVYMEAYTSLLSFGLSSNGLSALETMYGKPITIDDREMVEEKADEMLSEASDCDVAILVVGDPFGQENLGLKDLLDNLEIVNLDACLIYTIVLFSETVEPVPTRSLVTARPRYLNLHHIGVKEPTFESLCRGKKQYEPPRYMSINTAIEQLLEIEEKEESSGKLGSEDQKVEAGPMGQLLRVDFGEPLHCLVITGETHPIEEEMLDFYKLQVF
uniref:diphthine methyl ester synthase n=1 Tax=Kalanchoe fedtschenkoi TaxID=63787 RepID=A0A7N0R9S2_KALFE